MAKYPLFIDLEEKTIVIIGGGKVAAGKAERLHTFTSNILVVANETEIDSVPVINRSYTKEDLLRGDIIIAATGDPDTDKSIAEEAKKLGKSVNVASDPDLGNFYMPAVIKRGDVVIGVSTNGTSPAFARYLKEEIETHLPEYTELISLEMTRLRDALKSKVTDQESRKKIYENALQKLLKEDYLTEDKAETIITEMFREIDR